MVGLLSATACSGVVQESERETVYQAESILTIRVINHSQLDATINLMHDGTRDRLGTVPAASTGPFPVRTRTLDSGDFALMAVGQRQLDLTPLER